jgi:2-dehydro-3-deoxyphosphooctonate aldolase (KDO 8-P synthase)
MEVGVRLRDRCRALGLPYIFKASFDKANRSSVQSARGPGLADGLAVLARIRDDLGVPITTDLHDASQAETVAETVDLLQIPAFLCRQTDLLFAAGTAAAKYGRGVNVKKGQFLSPREMAGPVRKLAEAGCQNAMLTERGTFFGYHRLVNDFIGLGDLMELDCTAFTKAGSPPVCFDVTHSTQLPGSGEQTGGRPDRARLLARAAAATGVQAMFIEAHPEPKKALSDGATQLSIDEAEQVLAEASAIRKALDEACTEGSVG